MKKFIVECITTALACFIWGNVAVLTYQQIYLPDTNWGVCWKQDNTLTEINAFKWRLSYNGASPFDITPSCTGTQPFDCVTNSKVPLALQVGTLHIKLEAANVQSDGTLTDYSIQLEDNITFGVAKLPPAAGHGSGLGLKKLLEALMNFLFRPSH